MATKQPAGQPPLNRKAPNGPVGPWTERVRYSAQGYAFRPNQILGENAGPRKRALAAVRKAVDGAGEVYEEELFDRQWLIRSDADFDVEAVVDQLRRDGLRVDPNHVLFSHGCSCGGAGSPLAANPLYASSVSANPLYASSVGANPLYASPLYASAYYANPLYASQHQTSGERPSSALPGDEPDSFPAPSKGLAPGVARGFVLDTGLAAEPPTLLNGGTYRATLNPDRDYPDESRDGFLDPASGHGTFIAGIIEQIAPGQQTYVRRVLSTMGDGDVAKIATRLDTLRESPKDKSHEFNEYTVINLSFGGYADVAMPTLRTAIEKVQATGAVVVASAGNDGRCDLSYPAAFPGVVAVGSIEPTGRAPYSNYGPWVDACAPGTDLTSAFHTYNGGHPVQNGVDPDDYDNGWAQWTGTSFAAPVVAATLMRHIALTGETAAQAVAAIIEAPGLFRFPGLGTVVNVIRGM